MEQFGQSPIENQTGMGKKSSWGAVIGTVIVVAIIIIGGLYIWGGVIKKDSSQTMEPSDEAAAMATEFESSGGAEINDLGKEVDGLDEGLIF